MHNMAAIFTQAANDDWAALASMLGILIGVSSVVGVLIARIVVKPMIDAATEKVISRMVTLDKFQDYEKSDRREHDAMQKQLDSIFHRMNTTHD